MSAPDCYGKRRPAVRRWADKFHEAEQRVKALETELAEKDDKILRLTKQLDAERELNAAISRMSYHPKQDAKNLERLDQARRILKAVNDWAGKKRK